MTTHFSAALHVPLGPNVFQFVKVATLAHFLRDLWNINVVNVFLYKTSRLITGFKIHSAISRLGKRTNFCRAVNFLHCVDWFTVLRVQLNCDKFSLKNWLYIGATSSYLFSGSADVPKTERSLNFRFKSGSVKVSQLNVVMFFHASLSKRALTKLCANC